MTKIDLKNDALAAISLQQALALQASVLLRAGGPVAEAFGRSRLGGELGGEHGLAFGTLSVDIDAEPILQRARPT